MNDQRRAISDEYINLVLTVGNEYIEISARNPIAARSSITPQELKEISCVLISSKEQRENEREYYQGVVGFQSDFLYAENLEEARLMVIGGQGFMPVEGVRQADSFDPSISRIPLFRGIHRLSVTIVLSGKRIIPAIILHRPRKPWQHVRLPKEQHKTINNTSLRRECHYGVPFFHEKENYI